MPDLLSIVERGLKAVRYGFFCVNDQIALALDGLCHTPAMDYVDYTEHLDPEIWEGAWAKYRPPVSAVSPQAAEGPSDSDSAIPPAPSPRGTPTSHMHVPELRLRADYDPLVIRGDAWVCAECEAFIGWNPPAPSKK